MEKNSIFVSEFIADLDKSRNCLAVMTFSAENKILRALEAMGEDYFSNEFEAYPTMDAALTRYESIKKSKNVILVVD